MRSQQHRISRTVLRYIVWAILALVSVGDIPYGKGDYLRPMGILHIGALGDHDMPIIPIRSDEVFEQEPCVFHIIFGVLLAMFETIVPLGIKGHREPHNIDHIVQIRQGGSTNGTCYMKIYATVCGHNKKATAGDSELLRSTDIKRQRAKGSVYFCRSCIAFISSIPGYGFVG